MPLIADPRYTGAAIGMATRELMSQPASPEPEPSLLDTLASGARQSTLSGGLYERLTNADPDIDTPANYNPLDDIKGFEDHASSFVNADSASDVAGIKNRIQSRKADLDVLRRAGMGGTATELVMNLTDPSFLVSAAVPEVAAARLLRSRSIMQSALEGAAGAAGYEAGMQGLQEDRTALESLLNISGGAMIGGVLGSMGRRVPRKEYEAVRKMLDETKLDPVRSEVGAASSQASTTLEQEAPARGVGTMMKASSIIPGTKTDLQIITESPSLKAQQILEDLAEVPILKQKNTEGIATRADSVESRVVQTDTQIANLQDEIHRAYRVYKDRGGELKIDEFSAEISKAARRGDESPISEVTPLAKRLREIFDAPKKEADRLGLFGEQDLSTVTGAESYFRRMYDRDAIRKNRAAWDATLLAHFMKDGADKLEARAAAEDVTRQILGADVGGANWNARVNVADAGPLKARTLDIPDAAIEPFLINDPVKVAKAYLRDLVPQIEITKRFGEKDMKDSLEQVTREFDIYREQVRAKAKEKGEDASEQLSKLQDQEKRTIDALIRVRDRVLGKATRSPESEGGKKAVNFVRGWRNIVAASKLGGTALVSIPQDMARISAQYGFLPTIGKLVKLATSPAFRALAKAQARRTGAAVEVALARRVQDAFDGAATEGWTQTLANGVYKYTGLNHWTDFSRTLSGTLLEDRVMKVATALADGGKVDSFALTRLAQLGLGKDELLAIAKEAKKHGTEVDGTFTSGSANWKNGSLAQKYDAAILKESRQLVLQPGAANRVWWMDSEVGKVLGQLKTFSLASANSYSGAIAASLGQKQYFHAAKFMGFMMMGGYLAHALRQAAAGFKPETDPGAAAGQALSESGLLGIIPDILSPVGRLLTRTAVHSGAIDEDNSLAGVFGNEAKYSDRNAISAVGGPALGAAYDVWDMAFNRLDNGLSAKDLHAIRRMLPFQNVWYLRRLINALEGDTADALGLEGATNQSTMDRLTQMEEFRKAQ